MGKCTSKYSENKLFGTPKKSQNYHFYQYRFYKLKEVGLWQPRKHDQCWVKPSWQLLLFWVLNAFCENKTACWTPHKMIVYLFPEIANYVVKPTKFRDVEPKTILGGSTLATCTHFPPKLLRDVTYGGFSNALSDAAHFSLDETCYWCQKVAPFGNIPLPKRQ